ncbi:MAG: LysR family transcriptional regulator [Granulosicoccus sp.]
MYPSLCNIRSGRKTDKWTELRAAYQVSKLGTVSAAAEFLGFHRETVNCHIDVLEEEFGVRIFIRHSRGYTLKEAGHELLRAVEKTEDSLKAWNSTRRCRQQHDNGSDQF